MRVFLKVNWLLICKCVDALRLVSETAIFLFRTAGICCFIKYLFFYFFLSPIHNYFM